MALQADLKPGLNLSKMGAVIARLGVLTCALAVVATASLLALSIG